jgi:hypothetical protein
MNTSSTATVMSSVPSTDDKQTQGSKIIAADDASSGGGSIFGAIIGILIIVLVIVGIWFAIARGPVWFGGGPRSYGYGYAPPIIGGPVLEIGGRPGWGGGGHWGGEGHHR